MSRPIVLVIEGVDCVGKTTLARSIARTLRMEYMYTPQEPFLSIRKRVEEMKDLPTRFFYYLSCVTGVQGSIEKLLHEGKSVVIDRYVYSTFAMHKALGVNTNCVDFYGMGIHPGDCRILLSATRTVRRDRILHRGGDNPLDSAIEQCHDVLDMAQDEFRIMPLHEITTDTLSCDEVHNRALRLAQDAIGG